MKKPLTSLILENPEVIENKKEVSDELISYLIEKTIDVDAFVKVRQHSRQGCTALFFALEADDTITCRKLIKAGADEYRKTQIRTARDFVVTSAF